MKKNILIISVIVNIMSVEFFNIQSQTLCVPGGKDGIENSGNSFVGIGINNPQSVLHVKGTSGTYIL